MDEIRKGKNFFWVMGGIAFLGLFFTLKFLPAPKAPVRAETSPSEEARAIVQRGWELETRGQLDEAFALYNEALMVDPGCAVAYKHRGTVYTRKGAFEKAIPEFEKAAELDPTHASTFYNLGNLYLDMADYDNAIRNFSKAIELNPGYTAALMNRASVYARKKEFGKAIEDYERLLGFDPKNKDMLLARVAAYQLMGKTDEAIESCNKAIEVLPDEKDLYSRRAALYFGQKKMEEALADFGKVLEFDPKDITAYEGRIYINEFLAKPMEVQADMEQVKKIDQKQYQKVLVNNVAFLLSQKRYNEANQRIEEILAVDPSNFLIKEIQATVLTRQDNLAEAVKVIGELVAQKSDNTDYYLWRASLLSKLNDHENAFADLNKAIGLAPKDPATYLGRAMGYLAKGDYDQSWQDIKTARELGGRPSRDLLFELETKSSRTDPQVPLNSAGDYYNHYIQLYTKGYLKRAYSLVEEALQKFPDDADLKQVKEYLDETIAKFHNGVAPEKIVVRGADFVLDAVGNVTEQINKGYFKEVKLGAMNEADSIIFSFGTVFIQGPADWSKKADFRLENGTRALVHYQKFENTEFPSVLVTADALMSGTNSALEYSRKIREMYKGYSPEMDISEPKEDTVGNYQASYMEIGGKGTHDVAFRFAWYQFLFESQIITVQFMGSEYQLKEGFAEFRKVVESLKFQADQPAAQ